MEPHVDGAVKDSGIRFKPTADQVRQTHASWLKGRGVASGATFRAWRGDGAVRDPVRMRQDGDRSEKANPQVTPP